MFFLLMQFLKIFVCDVLWVHYYIPLFAYVFLINRSLTNIICFFLLMNALIFNFFSNLIIVCKQMQLLELDGTQSGTITAYPSVHKAGVQFILNTVCNHFETTPIGGLFMLKLPSLKDGGTNSLRTNFFITIKLEPVSKFTLNFFGFAFTVKILLTIR